jgi:hypothetical protein
MLQEPSHPRSVQKIVTQSLVISAIAAERLGSVSWAALHDLSVLINFIVLYDELYVLDAPERFHRLSPASDLLGLLTDERILRSEKLDEDTAARVAGAAQRHLLHFLGSKGVTDSGRFERLLSYVLSQGAALCDLADRPDGEEDILIGTAWVHMVPDNFDLVAALAQEDPLIGRGAAFFARTFLYLGYSDVRAMPLMVDSARCSLVRTVLKQEKESFRMRVLAALQDSHRQIPRAGETALRTVVSPFASIVFDRCNGDRSRLAREVQTLRSALASTRREFAMLEFDALWEKDSASAQARMERILAEIEHGFGPHPGLFTWEKGLSFAEDTAKTVAQPTNPASWIQLLSTPVEAMRQLAAKRPVAAIHDLRREIPGPLSLRKNVEDLFGPITD